MDVRVLQLRSLRQDPMELMFLLHGSREEVLSWEENLGETVQAIHDKVLALDMEASNAAPVYFGYGGARNFDEAVEWLRGEIHAIRLSHRR